MTEPTYTISIAVHNNVAATKTCLLSLMHWCKRDGLEIIVTDNASRDGTTSFLESLQRKDWPIRLVRRTENEGFPAAHNRALTLARGTYFLVLNNDVVVTGPDLLKKMSSALDSGIALCGADSAPSELDNHGYGRGGRRTEYIEGSCLMGKADFLRQWTLFDAGYEFGYCEDSDLGLRFRDEGHRLIKLRLPIRHERGTTAGTLDQGDAQRLAEAHRRNHETLRTRWADYLRSSDRLFRAECIARPVSIVTLSRFDDLLQSLTASIGVYEPEARRILVHDAPGTTPPPPYWDVVRGISPFVYARNANLGIKAAGQDDVLLVNDDVRFTAPGGIAELQRLAYTYPDFGILAPSVIGEIGNALQRKDARNDELIDSQTRLCFVCVYLKRQVLRHLGPLCEEFTAYGGDDSDYCLRAKRAGYKLGITRRVVVEHGGSTSFRRLLPEEERVKQMATMNAILREKYGTDEL